MDLIDAILERTIGALFGWIPVSREGALSNGVIRGLVGSFRLVGLARFSTDKEKSISGRSRLMWDEAELRGIEMQQIVMFGKYLEQYRARIGGKWFYFQSIPIPYWLPQKGYDWLDDKFRLASRLSASGIPAPKVAHVTFWFQARRAYARLNKPLIVKPRAGSRGRHTTTNIREMEELRAAYKLGKMIALSLVMEEHLYGSVYRATVIDGKLVGFFRADPPQVTGDGIRTIQELITEKNARKHADPATKDKLGDIEVNDDLHSFVARKGCTLASVIPQGFTRDLSAKTGRLYGGYTREMLPEVHPKMHEIFARAGTVVQASIVGFDLIIPDPKADPDTQSWGVIEANSLPFIDLHYLALEGAPINLAKNIWDLWEERHAT